MIFKQVLVPIPRKSGGSGLFKKSVIFFQKERMSVMLFTIAVILIALWLLGFLTSTTMGGVIHILLVIAIIMILLRVISGRRVL